ncbi:MAG: hypothetical protein M1832_002740 [Thelocarpon impressellum]|nr:MAG: hypothetical protein M1832_002740 [Thelocarpon impressellum]
MGSGGSKAAPQSSQHVFSSESPVRFSQELVDSLQDSPETDTTRMKTQELHIQARVAEELQRLQAREAQALRDLEDKISAEPASSDDGRKGGESSDLGRAGVQRDIATLRQRLDGRRKLEELDRDVARAKDEVVQCLRTHERRPLDCWKEVEAFRKEVGRLERGFVDRALR